MSAPSVSLNHDLTGKVAFLAAPGALGRAGEVPIARETHMSWVFLTADRVFKLKKPVRFSYLDFSTLGAREAACKEELRLNQTLAPDVYLRVARLTCAANGGYDLEGTGDTRDWLVVMRRLPEDAMLDARLKSGDVTRAEIEKLALLLVDFYRDAPRADIAPESYALRFRRQLATDREIVLTPRFAIDHERARLIVHALEHALSKHDGELDERVRAGAVIDAHGDLRPEHISLSDPIRIIDRLEFNRELRLMDPFDELAFLSMECAAAGADWIGPLLLARAEKFLPPRPSDELIRLYTALRASLRARLALAHLLDEHPRDPAKWAPQAERYLDQAGAALNLRRPAER